MSDQIKHLLDFYYILGKKKEDYTLENTTAKENVMNGCNQQIRSKSYPRINLHDRTSILPYLIHQ